MNMMDVNGLLKHTGLGTNMTITLHEKIAVMRAVREQFGPQTSYTQLLDEICRLKYQILALEKRNSDLGWQISGESMGR